MGMKQRRFFVATLSCTVTLLGRNSTVF